MHGKTQSHPRWIYDGWATGQKMNTTVRTLQYYDKEGLLSPSAESEGGRRLYTQKDMAALHQILSLKSLGFSLEDIKNRQTTLDDPQEMYMVLQKQEDAIHGELERLTKALGIIDVLKKEIVQSHSVDFDKYADIITLLHMKSEDFEKVRSLQKDEKLVSHIGKIFSSNPEKGTELYLRYRAITDEILALMALGESPTGAKGQEMAQRLWNMVTSFTGGDMTLLPMLGSFDTDEKMDDEAQKQQALVKEFMGKAMPVYFVTQNIQIPQADGGISE